MSADADTHTTTDAQSAATHDGFVPLQVERVTRETEHAVSLHLQVPPAAASQFRYEAGQFITIRCDVDGEQHRRCYSMSSTPSDDGLRITVKRTRDGVVSNWVGDRVSEGDLLHALPPEGRFVLGQGTSTLVMFAGGSGITPVLSIVRSALAGTDRRVILLYANTDADSVIFRGELDDLLGAFGDRLTVHHHLDAESGFLTPEAIRPYCSDETAEYFICGPAPFMEAVEKEILQTGIDPKSVHLERFEIAAVVADDDPAAVVTREVKITLGRTKKTVDYRPGNTLLQTVRSAGLRAPSSCETGSCGTCMARLKTGTAQMINNDALDDDEVADGWVLTCQSLPTSETVHVVYE